MKKEKKESNSMESHRKEVEEQSSSKQWSLAAVFADRPDQW